MTIESKTVFRPLFGMVEIRNNKKIKEVLPTKKLVAPGFEPGLMECSRLDCASYWKRFSESTVITSTLRNLELAMSLV